MTDWSAVGRRSRRKGKTYEREVARILRDATKTDWQTTRNSGRTDLGGDVFCPGCPDQLRSPFDGVMIECKHREGFNLVAMICGNAAYKLEMAKVLADFGGRTTYDTLAMFVKNDSGLWVAGVRRVGHVFCARRPAVLLRDSMHQTWNYVGYGQTSLNNSAVIAQLVEWMQLDGSCVGGQVPTESAASAV